MPRPEDPRSLLPLPHLEYQILVSLADRELHGYAIVKEVAQRSRGLATPSTGSLYLAIARLLEHGLIVQTASEGGGRRRRKTYRLSGFGARVTAAETERLGELARLAHERLRASHPAAGGGPGGKG